MIDVSLSAEMVVSENWWWIFVRLARKAEHLTPTWRPLGVWLLDWQEDMNFWWESTCARATIVFLYSFRRASNRFGILVSVGLVSVSVSIRSGVDSVVFSIRIGGFSGGVSLRIGGGDGVSLRIGGIDGVSL